MRNSILIIDDTTIARKQIIETLRNAGLFEHYFEASDGVAGFKTLLNEKIDIVLCDVEMPGMDGFKFLQMVNTCETLRDIPILLLTSHDGMETKIRGLEQGASDYITKPFIPEELLARVKIHLKIKTLQDNLKQSNQSLLQLSMTDPLTELNNRRHLMEILDKEFERSHRTDHPLAFLMIDIDHFKQVNDTYGHVQGDVVLQIISREITSELRQYDTAARFGGEEFALLLPETSTEQAFIVAERLRKSITDIKFSGSMSGLIITVSIGIASLPHPGINSAEDLIRLADDALYTAKKNGRNRVEMTCSYHDLPHLSETTIVSGRLTKQNDC